MKALESLLPRDLVTIVTRGGLVFQAEVRQVKRDRVQLWVGGQMFTATQYRDSKVSIPFADVATVKHTGRKVDPAVAVTRK